MKTEKSNELAQLLYTTPSKMRNSEIFQLSQNHQNLKSLTNSELETLSALIYTMKNNTRVLYDIISELLTRFE
jgi:hypothetical protein